MDKSKKKEFSVSNSKEETTGTDRPFGVVEWENYLGDNPTERQLRKLSLEIKARKSKLKEVEEQIEQELDRGLSSTDALEPTEHLADLYRESIKELESLLGQESLTLEEQIEIYVNEIRPISPNKKDYQKAFHFIYELPNAKDYSNTDLADKILLEYDDLSIKEESLRKIVRPFINKFLL